MDASSEAADQIVRMTLQGAEVALRITGAGAKNAAAIIAAAAASSHKTRGQARLASLLRSGKELRVFPIRASDLRTFAQEARRYGIVYTVVKQKGAAESVDLLVRAEDASKVNRIAERNGFARVSPSERAAPEGKPPKGRGGGTPQQRQAEDGPSVLEDLLAKPPERAGEDSPFGAPQAAGPPSGRTSGRRPRSEK